MVVDGERAATVVSGDRMSSNKSITLSSYSWRKMEKERGDPKTVTPVCLAIVSCNRINEGIKIKNIS